MAAQGERELGDIVMGEGLLDPVAQDIPEQEMLVVEEEQFIPPQMDAEPEMGAAAAEAAVYDTPPPHLRQIPSPTPSETGNGGAGLFSPSVVTQLMEMITQAMNGNAQRMEANLKANANEMKEETNGMKEQMKEMRGEMQQIGRGLQAGTARMLAITDKMAPPRAATSELKGSAPAGEDREIRETCRARIVTVTKWEKLIRVTETCTRERKEQLRRKARLRYSEIVEEQGVKQREGRERLVERARLTYVRIRERRRKEVETNRHKRLHDGAEAKDAHTHTHVEVVRDIGGELAERVGTRCEQLGVLPREQGEGVCPLEAGHGQVSSVVPREVEEVSSADGCTQSLGGMKTPGALVEASVSDVPRVSVPV